MSLEDPQIGETFYGFQYSNFIRAGDLEFLTTTQCHIDTCISAVEEEAENLREEYEEEDDEPSDVIVWQLIRIK